MKHDPRNFVIRIGWVKKARYLSIGFMGIFVCRKGKMGHHPKEKLQKTIFVPHMKYKLV